jgi:hypothetical protein
VQTIGALHSTAPIAEQPREETAMKTPLLLIALATAGVHAQTTINLEPTSCGSGLWCASVPNDAGDSILLYGSTNYQNVGTIVGRANGSFADYLSQNYRGLTPIYVGSCPASPAVGTMQLLAIPMAGTNGTSGAATVTANFSCTSVLGSSGRGSSWHQVWTLIEGQLTLQ